MTRPEVAAMLRRFADEFEADAPRAGYVAFMEWIEAAARLDKNAAIHLSAEILCWGDDHTPITTDR